jgi:hypothetical protein
MDTKMHAATDAEDRPIRFSMTEGQVSDYTGAAALMGGVPKVAMKRERVRTLAPGLGALSPSLTQSRFGSSF